MGTYAARIRNSGTRRKPKPLIPLRYKFYAGAMLFGALIGNWLYNQYVNQEKEEQKTTTIEHNIYENSREIEKKEQKKDTNREGIDPKKVIASLEASINDEYPEDPNTTGYWSVTSIEKFHNRYIERGYESIVKNILEKYDNKLHFKNNEIGLEAILAIESSMGEDKDSDANANGVAHIWKPTEETINNIAASKGYEFRLTNVMDDEQCIEAAAIYLEDIFEQEEFRNDPYLVAAAYNGGPEFVKQMLEQHGDIYEKYGFTDIVYDKESGMSVEMGLAAFFPDYMEETANYGRKFGSTIRDLEIYKLKKNLEEKINV